MQTISELSNAKCASISDTPGAACPTLNPTTRDCSWNGVSFPPPRCNAVATSPEVRICPCAQPPPNVPLAAMMNVSGLAVVSPDVVGAIFSGIASGLNASGFTNVSISAQDIVVSNGVLLGGVGLSSWNQGAADAFANGLLGQVTSPGSQNLVSITNVTEIAAARRRRAIFEFASGLNVSFAIFNFGQDTTGATNVAALVSQISISTSQVFVGALAAAGIAPTSVSVEVSPTFTVLFTLSAQVAPQIATDAAAALLSILNNGTLTSALEERNITAVVVGGNVTVLFPPPPHPPPPPPSAPIGDRPLPRQVRTINLGGPSPKPSEIGEAVGIVVGSTAGGFLLVAAAVMVLRSQRKRRSRQDGGPARAQQVFRGLTL